MCQEQLLVILESELLGGDVMSEENKYTRSDLDKFKKLCELFKNDEKWENAELLVNESEEIIYLHECYPAHSGYAWSYEVIKNIKDLEQQLMEEEKRGVISKGEARSICKSVKQKGFIS